MITTGFALPGIVIALSLGSAGHAALTGCAGAPAAPVPEGSPVVAASAEPA